MAEFKPLTLDDYYRIINPQDISRGVKFKSAETKATVSPDEQVFKVYINERTSGEDIIDELRDYEALKGKGWLYNTVFQDAGAETCEFLEDSYWSSTRPGAPSPTIINDYYKQVCGQNSPPPKSFSINVLRSPPLSAARAKTFEIEFFLNYMPSVFPSMMVPYFDIEFQLPKQGYRKKVKKDGKETTVEALFVNRPSLLRFLIGSQEKAPPLTAAESSLMSLLKIPTKDGSEEQAYFTGMEMFTTPQTLTNMDQLTAGANRVNDVKPFLPPASVTSATVQMLNAGAGKFVHKKADVELKIHDKARLPEFSEFIRGPAGYRDVTVFLTYGWLAPRGGEGDAYAKFINENMLVRESFMVKNSSFSFDAAGQVSLKIELVSKGVNSAQSDVISTANTNKDSIVWKIQKVHEQIARHRNAFGNAPEGAADMRIYQILDAAVKGEDEFQISDAELSDVLANAREAVKTSRTITDKDTALKLLDEVEFIYSRSGTGKTFIKSALERDIALFSKIKFDELESRNKPDPFLPQEGKKVGDELLFSDDLIKVMKETSYVTPSTDDTKWRSKEAQLSPAAAKWDADVRVKAKALNPQKPNGPFTPTDLDAAAKAFDPTSSGFASGPGKGWIDKKGPGTDDPSNNGSRKWIPKKEFVTQPVTAPPRVVSFGKLFSVFCLPALLTAAEKENIDEVQVNFYQLNESCGPLSLHSIAEFPIALDDFKKQYSEFALRRGGDGMTVEEFIRFVAETQLSDSRAPGFGMRSYYEAYTVDNPEEKAGGDEADFNAKMTKWFAKYGTFKKPNIGVKIETGPPAGSSPTKVDLLQDISFVGAEYAQRTPPTGTIKKIHIYDKQHNPYLKAATILKVGQSYAAYEGGTAESFSESIKKAYGDAPTEEQVKSFIDATSPGTKYTTTGRDVLRDYVGNSVPTLLIGANGTLISNAQLASKADGLIGTNNMQGGSFKAKSTLNPNGLSMEENNLPLRIVPAQLTMTSLGCPIADIYQAYFIDFGTGTTIDNLYSCTQLNHTFSPGKFETNWTFVYTDGYGKYYGAANIPTVLKDLTTRAAEKVQSENSTAENEVPTGGRSGAITAA